MIAFFLPAIPCIRFIHNDYLMFGTTFVLTLVVGLSVWRWMVKQTEDAHGLEGQIVRYDERVLAVDLSEALFDTEATADTLFYSVDKIRLEAALRTPTRTPPSQCRRCCTSCSFPISGSSPAKMKSFS